MPTLEELQAAKRGKQGEQAREKELLKAFGFEKVEDAQTALAEFKKLQDGQKSELEKAQQANAEWQKKFDALTKERDDANKARDDALEQIKSGLIRAAVMTEELGEAVRILDRAKWEIVDS
jgi:DNA repair ATPase RecN